MTKITYLDQPSKVTYLDESKGTLDTPEIDAFGNEIIRRGKAAFGGIEGAASMVSRLPQMAIGGATALGTGLVTGNWGAVPSVFEDVTEKIPYYKPKTEAGQDFEKMLEFVRSKAGEVGGDQSPGLMTANELAFDIATGIIPLGPAMRGRPKPGGDLIAEARANEVKKAAQPTAEPKITYLDQTPQQLDMGFPREGTIPPDVPSMMERARELTFEQPLQRQIEAAGPQADLFNDRGGQFPGIDRTAEMVRQREAVPYDGLSLVDETPQTRTGTITPETIDFPLRQEVLTRPDVQEIINSYRAEHARMLEEGATQADIARLENAFGEYMQKYGVRNAEEAHGLRRPLYETHAQQLPVQKTDRPNLGQPSKADWTKHEPTAFELGEGPIQLAVDRALSKQAGVFNPGVFVEGFNKAKIALGGAVKLMAFTNRDLSMLPEKVKDYVLSESGIAVKDYAGRGQYLEYGRGGPAFHIVAVDPRNNKPFGIVEFRRKGDYLESDWVTVDPAYRGQGIAKELYTFARELGNDIRASSARTPEGRKMWEAYGKTTKLEVDSRPVLPRLAEPPIRGPKRQEGVIKWQKDPDFEKFKSTLPEYWKKDAKQMYKKYKEMLADTPIKKDEGVRETLSEIPGVKKLLDEYQDNYKSIEELTDTFNQSPDIDGGIIGKTLTYGVLSGGDFVGRVFNSPMVKWGAHKVRSAQREIGRQVADILYNKETGIVPKWQALSKQDKASWSKLVIENEGKRSLSGEELRALGYDQPVIDFYLQTRQALDSMYEYGNAIRVAQGYKPLPKREGYYPAKFLGDFYVTVNKVNPETGMKEIVGLYASDSLREVKGFIKELKNKYQDNYEISPVIEKSRGTNREGFAHAYSVYSDLMRMVETGSPDAQVLQRLIDEYQQQSVKRTAGFFQHEKMKKGIEGSTGRNEFRDQVRNAEDMMRTLQGYTHQLFEYGEFTKIGADFRKLLDQNLFKDKTNTQEYLRWYFDQARGAEGRFAALQNDVIDFVAHQLGFGGSKIRAVGGLARSYLTWNLLSGHNAKFILQQMIQPSQFLAQNLARLRASGIEFTPGQMMDAWASGWTDSLSYRGGRAKGDLKSDLDWATKNHIFDQSVMHDLDNLLTDKGTNIWTLLNGNHTIRVTEQFGRMQVFVTFNKLLKNKLPTKQRLELAGDLTTSLMTDYRPFEMPAMYRMAGPIGTAASSLSRYKHNFFSQLIDFTADWIRSGGKPEKLSPILLTLGVNGLFAGLMGLPGREDLDFLLNILKDYNVVDTNYTQFVLQSKQPDYISHGLVSALTGADLSASLSAGAVLPSEHSLIPLLSKGIKVVGSAFEAASTRTEATTLDFLKEVLPVSAGGLMELAKREGEVVMGRGNEGSVRRSIDPTDAAWIKRYLSMRDLGEAKEKAATFEIKKDEDRRKGRVEKLIKRAYEDARQGENILNKYSEDMQKLNMMPNDLIQGMQRLHRERMTTEAERFGGIPPTSPQQIRKQQELQKYR